LIVDAGRGLWVKLDGLATYQQARTYAGPQELAQVAEGPAQVGAGPVVWLFRPKQGGQLFASVGPVSFTGEIDEQGADFVRDKAGDRLVIHPDVRGTQDRDL
jgi:hypothetical protein